MMDRKLKYFEPNAMATALYGLYAPETGEFTVSSAGHLSPVLAAPGGQAGPLPIDPDPPISVADDPHRWSATIAIPPGALLCCFTDGLVERRGQMLDQGIDTLASTLVNAAAAGTGSATEKADNACAGVPSRAPGALERIRTGESLQVEARSSLPGRPRAFVGSRT